VDLVGVDVEGAARPAHRLFQIEIKDQIEAAFVNRSMTYAAGRVAERLADIV
jgi:hypothetical protein